MIIHNIHVRLSAYTNQKVYKKDNFKKIDTVIYQQDKTKNENRILPFGHNWFHFIY